MPVQFWTEADDHRFTDPDRRSTEVSRGADDGFAKIFIGGFPLEFASFESERDELLSLGSMNLGDLRSQLKTFLGDDRFLLGIRDRLDVYLMFLHPGGRAFTRSSAAAVVVACDRFRHGTESSTQFPGFNQGLKTMNEDTYTDHKGRVRWHANDALAEKLKALHAFLVIGNYDASHAARYPRLAHLISRHPDSVLAMREANRLRELPGVSEVIEGIIEQLLDTGTCEKMSKAEGSFSPPPLSVLELLEIPRLGAKTARELYQHHGIDGAEALKKALHDGRLASVKGIGAGMLAAIEKHLKG